MIGIGLDAVDVPRSRRALARRPRPVERLVTDGGRADATRRADPTEHVADRFQVSLAHTRTLAPAVVVALGA